MRTIDVCPTPELLPLYDLEGKIAVIVDILRATSCMVTAIAHGIQSIIPVASVEECKELQLEGYVAAAERDARKVVGFDLDNSPFSYMNPALRNKKLAVTTTNGTLAISKSLQAEQLLIGAFLNKSTVANYLLSQDADVVVVCAGWKGKINLEDTLFAGALVEALRNEFIIEQDSALMAYTIYKAAKYNLFAYMAESSHVKRLQNL
ncbi:MAG: 2-phosphosulfolactate phosphatase, partial [Verrucomicrobia bacterium]|nr:2-phosphosulfolactate phosphatase [Cytophagales bacterium]